MNAKTKNVTIKPKTYNNSKTVGTYELKNSVVLYDSILGDSSLKIDFLLWVMLYLICSTSLSGCKLTLTVITSSASALFNAKTLWGLINEILSLAS